jgi:ATP-dependent Clp protease ATP-binding subunit ClpC
MGARPLRRAIQHYIEDPLADFVLRSQLPAGSTVLVEPAPQDDPEEREVKLSVIEPAPRPTPVGVGAADGGDEEAQVEPPAEEAAEGTQE